MCAPKLCFYMRFFFSSFHLQFIYDTAEKMKFAFKDFFSKYGQIRRKL